MYQDDTARQKVTDLRPIGEEDAIIHSDLYNHVACNLFVLRSVLEVA